MKLKENFSPIAILLVAFTAVLFVSGCKQKTEPSIRMDYMDLSVKPGE